MKQFYFATKGRSSLCVFSLSALFITCQHTASAQSCPLSSTDTIKIFHNTYYPANQANVASGSTSISLGAAAYGTAQINSGDILLIIQMQGAQINSTNTAAYGGGGASGSGYLNNANLLAGNMEYMVAANSVPTTGGTLNLVTGLTNSYRNTPFGTDGQYTYQVIRVPVYYNLKISATITAPRWNGSAGGVIVLYATDSIQLNFMTIDASGLGFRGAGGRSFTGAGTGSSTDYITNSSSNANGGKGEGIAGTPKYLNDNNSFLDVSATEGYPNGSYGRGAPANGGGGGTDGNPANNNDENTGGGGGGNAGPGGNGGWAWSSATQSGGKPGAVFAQASPSRLVMGGGGGAGTTNNGTGTPGLGFASSGAAGGGIIIMMASAITGTGTIKVNGGTANGSVVNDGAGGAGAGGSILLYASTGNYGVIKAYAQGGAGGNNEYNVTSGQAAHGPGGGGGGGYIFANFPLNAVSTAAGGAAGTTKGYTDPNYGATSGSNGTINQTITQTQTPPFPMQCIILPVNFLSVTAAQQNGIATVKWEVTQEINTLEYIVEKSQDGNAFTAIGHLPYKTSDGLANQYEYADNNSFSAGGAVYYRIKEVDAKGGYLYSKTVSVKVSGLAGKVSVFPNPASGSATVSFASATQGAISLRLFDLKGSLLWQEQYQANIGQNAVPVDNLRTFPNGIYILQWFDGVKPEQVKVMVNH